jgi:hypothetical protein
MKSAFRKCGYDVTASEHIRGVDETKCILISHIRKLNTVKFSGGPSRVKGIHGAVPPNPQEIQPMWLVVDHSRTNIYYISVINAKNSCISEGMIGGRIVIVS